MTTKLQTAAVKVFRKKLDDADKPVIHACANELMTKLDLNYKECLYLLARIGMEICKARVSKVEVADNGIIHSWGIEYKDGLGWKDTVWYDTIQERDDMYEEECGL